MPKKKSVKMTPAKVAAIAKDAVKVMAEKKYMDTNNSLKGLNPTRPTGNDYISAIGFSTTTNESDDQSILVFGGQQIKEMLCLKPFQSNAADQDLRMFAPIGKRIQPVSCKSSWRINRQFARIDPALGATPADFPASLAENLPVVCRMVRVIPKISAGTETAIAPDDDLFQDEYGRATSVSDDTFTEQEMLSYRVNKRRYKVLEDKKFILRPPVTLQYGAVFPTPRQDGAKVNAEFYPIVSNTNGNCEKYMTTYDQLSSRRNGSCFYTDPTVSSTNTATTGHQRSYYFYMFAYQGADTITGDEAGRAKGPIDIVVDLTNYTKFIDI